MGKPVALDGIGGEVTGFDYYFFYWVFYIRGEDGQWFIGEVMNKEVMLFSDDDY